MTPNPYERIRLPFVRAKLATTFTPAGQLLANRTSQLVAMLSLKPDNAAMRREFAENIERLSEEMRSAK